MEFRAALDEIFGNDLSEGASAKADRQRGPGFPAENILDGNYDTYWTTDDDVTAASITISLDGEKTFNRIMLQEYIPLGQRIAEFNIEALAGDGAWEKISEGTTIGYKRILLTEEVTASKVRINILKSYACPVLNGFGLYLDGILDY